MNQTPSWVKRALLLLLLTLTLFLLASCYMEPDRVVDNTGINNDPSQTFESVLTPTPSPSPYIAQTVTQEPGSVDWSTWTFGNDTATNPPSGVTVTQDPATQQIVVQDPTTQQITVVQDPTTQQITVVQDPTTQQITTTVTQVPNYTVVTSATQIPGTTKVPGAATMPPQTVTNAGKATVTATPAPKATPTATPVSSSLKRGSTGSSVKKLQQKLKDLGYYTGSVDGTFGEGTENAVKAFQKANGLTADGKAGVNTLNKLYGNSAKKATVAVTATPKSNGTTKATTKPSTKTTSKTSTTAKPKSQGTVSPAQTAVPSSKYTSGKTNLYLKLGDTGANVKYMQNRLIELGYLTGKADGTFGSTTEDAVKAFQKRNDIWSDGVAGPSTLSLLYSSSCKRAASPAGTLGSLREGYNGSAVRTLQSNLKKLGYYKGSVDGDYGTATTAAVTSFQEDYNLTADGVAGIATLNAISEALNGGSSSSSKTNPATYGKTASSNGYSSICATNGSTKQIKNLQSALSSLGFYSGDISGTYSDKTKSAVSSYQKAAGLRVTGIAGPTTQRLLYGGTKESGSYTKLENGSSGTKVKQLQYALYELKYYDGNITGEYDNATESAVMEFQEQNGLEIDGVAGVDTQRRLFSSNAIPCQ